MRCSATRRWATHAPPGSTRELGALRPGYKADLILIDLDDVAYLPYNSAARQLVYTESGRAVESVIVDGRIVMKDRKVKTIDEDALRREVTGLMRHFIADYEAIVASRKRALALHAGGAPEGVAGRCRHEPVHSTHAVARACPGRSAA